MPPLRIRFRPHRISTLHVDIENRPLAYLGHDFTTAEITAIAVSWADGDPVIVWLLGRDDPRQMLVEFASMYDAADIITGHYILRHDLPIINGAMLEHGLPPLKPTWVSDTKLHLAKRHGLSASQENLAATFGLAEGKEHMNNWQWREANRLTSEGLRLTETRVRHDVQQHKALRAKLLELGMLGHPKPWRSLGR